MKPTFQATHFVGRTFWFTVALTLLLGGSAEWIARSDTFQTRLTPPQMSSRRYQLSQKLSLLDKEVRRNGPVDCIMIGSSMVDVGFDPDSFQEAYRKAAGQDIRCFNFGIDASTAASSAAIARILVEDHHPRLLIFGTDPRDYAVPSDDRDPAAVLASPWVQYRQGNFSLEGWLQEHSYLHRYRQHFSRLARFQFEGTLSSRTQSSSPTLPNGFTPRTEVSDYINEPYDPQDESYEVMYNIRIFSNYQMLEENLAALERIMSYNGTGTQVIIMEMPVADGLYYFFGNSQADYDRFVIGVNELASRHNIPFWRTEPLDLIPDDGWSDYSHLNAKGAGIMSAWLGSHVAEAERRGSIQVHGP
jgi:hypothetical protein